MPAAIVMRDLAMLKREMKKRACMRSMLALIMKVHVCLVATWHFTLLSWSFV
jgi:hypothetical protein